MDGVDIRVYAVVPESLPSPGEDRTDERQRWLAERAGQERSTGRTFPGASVRSSHSAGWHELHWTSRVLHRLGDIAGHSGSGVVAATLVMAWALIGLGVGFPQWWQITLYSTAGSVTFVMVFVIQHTNERQTFATQRKLDELIRSSTRADDTLIAVEEAADGQLQALADLNLADRERASTRTP
jgi:low affinity Fe/Cu permease